MSETIQVIERAMRLLMAFDEERSELRVTELAEILGLNKTTVHRILRTLMEGGLIEQNSATNKYRLGWRLISLGHLAIQHFSLRELAEDILEELLDTYKETVDLAIYQDGRILYLDLLESPQPVKIAAHPGRRLPVHCTATGKAYLAFSPSCVVEEVVEIPLHAYTERTITTLSKLKDDLELSRERGFCISREEFEQGICAVASPAFNADGEVEVIIAIAGPSYRMPDSRLATLGKAVQDAALRLTERLEGVNSHTLKR